MNIMQFELSIRDELKIKKLLNPFGTDIKEYVMN